MTARYIELIARYIELIARYIELIARYIELIARLIARYIELIARLIARYIELIARYIGLRELHGKNVGCCCFFLSVYVVISQSKFYFQFVEGKGKKQQKNNKKHSLYSKRVYICVQHFY